MTLEEAIEGLKAGKKLRVDRRDCPILPQLLMMQSEGTLKQEFVEVDEQYSYVEFSWNP